MISKVKLRCLFCNIGNEHFCVNNPTPPMNMHAVKRMCKLFFISITSLYMGNIRHSDVELTTLSFVVDIKLKAILQVLIYKALYDKSYLGSKTTMTSGEWTCLISFATAPLTCSERGGSEKFKMKIYVSSGIRTHTPPVHDRKVAAP